MFAYDCLSVYVCACELQVLVELSGVFLNQRSVGYGDNFVAVAVACKFFLCVKGGQLGGAFLNQSSVGNRDNAVKVSVADKDFC